MISDFVWVAEVEEEVPIRFQTAEELKAFIDIIERRESGELVIDKDYGEIRTRWWERLFGRPAYVRDRRICFLLLWSGPYASLTFMDDAGSEYRAIDHERPVDASQEVRLRLSGGEPTPLPPETCLQKARVFAAAREFIDTERRPDWLSYRYVR